MAAPGKHLRSEGGQMAVELAIVAPVILVVLVIVIDMLVFAGECARFDHIEMCIRDSKKTRRFFT